MKKVCLILKSKNPEAKKSLTAARKFLSQKGYKVYLDLKKSILKNKLEWIMVFGGDGAVLHAANKTSVYNIPLIGVNYGHKGYICQIKPYHLIDDLKKLIKKQYSIRGCAHVKAEIINQQKNRKTIDALNEIVIGGITRTVWLDIKIKNGKDRRTMALVGDGLIVSTKTGSTAYNLYAGGSVLLINAFSVVASNALINSTYFLPNTKSIIAPLDTIFEITSQRTGKFLPYVVADGQRDYRLRKNDKVIISRSNLITKLIELKK